MKRSLPLGLYEWWEKFNETILPEKGFYSNLSLEEITDVDYMYGKKFVKTLKYEI